MSTKVKDEIEKHFLSEVERAANGRTLDRDALMVYMRNCALNGALWSLAHVDDRDTRHAIGDALRHVAQDLEAERRRQTIPASVLRDAIRQVVG